MTHPVKFSDEKFVRKFYSLAKSFKRVHIKASIYADNPLLYKKLTGRNFFKENVNGIKNLFKYKEKNTTITIATLLHKAVKNNIFNILKFIDKEFKDASIVHLEMLQRTGRAVNLGLGEKEETHLLFQLILWWLRNVKSKKLTIGPITKSKVDKVFSLISKYNEINPDIIEGEVIFNIYAENRVDVYISPSNINISPIKYIIPKVYGEPLNSVFGKIEVLPLS